MVTRRRNTELVLIVLAVLLALFGYADAGLALGGTVPSTLLPVGLGLGALAVGAHLAVRRFAPFADPLILPVAVMLSGIGLVLITRLDWSYEVEYHSRAQAPNQVMWL